MAIRFPGSVGCLPASVGDGQMVVYLKDEILKFELPPFIKGTFERQMNFIVADEIFGYFKKDGRLLVLRYDGTGTTYVRHSTPIIIQNFKYNVPNIKSDVATNGGAYMSEREGLVLLDLRNIHGTYVLSSIVNECVCLFKAEENEEYMRDLSANRLLGFPRLKLDNGVFVSLSGTNTWGYVIKGDYYFLKGNNYVI